MKRVARFGKDMMPKKEKPKSVLSKKPRLFRRLKKIVLKMPMLSMQKDLQTQ